MITLRQARENTPFQGRLKLVLRNGGGAYVLPQAFASYELQLFRHNNSTPFATGTVANGKIAIVATADATTVDYAFPATDMVGLLGYGSMKLISTVVGSVPVCIPPLQFVKTDTPYTQEFGEALVVYDETIVCVVESFEQKQILEPITVVVNTLAPGSAATGVMVGNTLTLGIPQGAQGIQGIQGIQGLTGGTVALPDLTRGTMALNQLASGLLGQKAVVLDFVGGGFAHVDEGAAQQLLSLANVPGITITNATGGKRLTRKRRFENIGANELRYHHGVDGSPQGVLIEAAHAYINKRSQPTVAQCSTRSNVSDATAPAGATGNWQEVTTSGTDAYSYQEIAALVGGQSYYWKGEVWTSDGLAPIVGLTAGCSFAPNVGGEYAASRNPITGAGGANVVGKTATGAWIVECYFDAASYPNLWAGWVRTAAMTNAHTIKVGQINVGPGRYAPSFFDNTTATPNSRAADYIAVPVSGFTSDMVTMVAEFVAPYPSGIHTPVHLGSGGINDRMGVYFDGSSVPYGFYIAGGAYRAGNALSSAVTPGQKYRMAVAWDAVSGRMRSKLTGLTAVDVAMSGSGTSVAPTTLEAGCGLGNDLFQSTISLLAVVDRAWTAAEIAAFTG